MKLNEALALKSVVIFPVLRLKYESALLKLWLLALGHPLGASGARIMVSLLYNLAERRQQTGIAALCVGGGIGMAMQVTLHD